MDSDFLNPFGSHAICGKTSNDGNASISEFLWGMNNTVPSADRDLFSSQDAQRVCTSAQMTTLIFLYTYLSESEQQAGLTDWPAWKRSWLSFTGNRVEGTRWEQANSFFFLLARVKMSHSTKWILFMGHVNHRVICLECAQIHMVRQAPTQARI